jgi:hypothetical protein
MSQDVFSPEEIERLSREMDNRLNQLASGEATTASKGIFGPSKSLPLPQKEVAEVEKALAETGQDTESFWRRFQKAARGDICQEGGVLHAQWKRWGDLSNQKVIKQLGAILAAMGFSGNVLQMLALACGVIVIHIGVKAYCMESNATDSAAQ